MGSGVDYLVMGAAVLFDLPLWVIFISRTLSGTTSAAFCMAYAYVADVSEPHRRSQNFGLLVLAHATDAHARHTPRRHRRIEQGGGETHPDLVAGSSHGPGNDVRSCALGLLEQGPNP